MMSRDVHRFSSGFSSESKGGAEGRDPWKQREDCNFLRLRKGRCHEKWKEERRR